MRAAAIAASQPACPAPTTTTSYCSVKGMKRVRSYSKSLINWAVRAKRANRSNPLRSGRHERSRRGGWVKYQRLEAQAGNQLELPFAVKIGAVAVGDRAEGGLVGEHRIGIHACGPADHVADGA